MKYYSGVGSRQTPQDILALIENIAVVLAQRNFTLRSGGAYGADKAFEIGAGMDADIFYADQATQAAADIAKQFHPAWHRCSNYARKLHARNAFQVLGINLDTPSKFLICWTPDGCEYHANRSIKTGGTGTAISIANHYNVPVFNLANETSRTRICTKILNGEKPS